ncbi:MAG: tripartite tricarboxylate transporter substrate binding protein [Burkholderiales bacterium]
MRSSGYVSAVALMLTVFACTLSITVPAQPYPMRPIRFIVPYPPGGSTDYTAREIAQRLSDLWGQQLVIDNRGGAGSLIGHALAANAPSDGYTLLLGTSTGLSIAPALGTKLAYDPQKDLAPIGLAVYAPYLLVVHASIPATSVKEFIEYAKKQPGKLNYGSSGIGTPNHLGGELMDLLAGIRTVHVPYKGGGPAMTDLISGQLQYMLTAIPQALPHVKSGRLRALATGHPSRTRAAPDLPPIAETLPGFNNTTWYGLLAPARTPRAIIQRINADLGKILAQPELAQRMLSQGIEAASSTPEGLGEMIRTETERWRKVIKGAGIAVEAIR